MCRKWWCMHNRRVLQWPRVSQFHVPEYRRASLFICLAINLISDIFRPVLAEANRWNWYTRYTDYKLYGYDLRNIFWDVSQNQGLVRVSWFHSFRNRQWSSHLINKRRVCYRWAVFEAKSRRSPSTWYKTAYIGIRDLSSRQSVPADFARIPPQDINDIH